MLVRGVPYRTIWMSADGCAVEIIDQTRLPHEFAVTSLVSLADVTRAIATMQVRGAPLIGVAAAHGLALAAREDASDEGLGRAGAELVASRPTAVNLRWAVERVLGALSKRKPDERTPAALELAKQLADEDVAACRAIGVHGLEWFTDLWRAKGQRGRLEILTHCNAGWLATVDHGTALAPVYAAHDAGLPIHVWVDETRPRNQGASLTAWELTQHGVPHTLIVDNAGGHLMQHGRVDACIVGADRITARGDVCNKVGTYLKALAARDNRVPFYVAAPLSTFDVSLQDGVAEIPIEERGADEVLWVEGAEASGRRTRVRIAPEGTTVANHGFDVTPARLVAGYVCERGRAGELTRPLLAQWGLSA